MLPGADMGFSDFVKEFTEEKEGSGAEAGELAKAAACRPSGRSTAPVRGGRRGQGMDTMYQCVPLLIWDFLCHRWKRREIIS